jgi:hypothetical protein
MGTFRRHLSYANVVATMALVFAMSGGALAATHYLITKTSQIKPSVLKKLKGNIGHTGATGATGPIGPQGPAGKEGQQGVSGTTVVDRIRSLAPIATTTGSEAKDEIASLNDPLNGSFTQGADEVDQILGQVTFTAPAAAHCTTNTSSGKVTIAISVDGTVVADVEEYGNDPEKPVTVPVEFYDGNSLPSWTLFEPGTATARTVTATVGDECGWEGGKTGAHFTIDAIELDVLGAH